MPIGEHYTHRAICKKRIHHRNNKLIRLPIPLLIFLPKPTESDKINLEYCQTNQMPEPYTKYTLSLTRESVIQGKGDTHLPSLNY